MVESLVIRLCPDNCQQVLLLILLTHKVQSVSLVFNVGLVVDCQVFHLLCKRENIYGLSAVGVGKGVALLFLFVMTNATNIKS